MIYTQSKQTIFALSLVAALAAIGGIFCVSKTGKIPKNNVVTCYPKKRVDHVKKVVQNGSTVAQDLKMTLDKVHKKALADLKKEFKIKTQDWDTAMRGLNYAKSVNPIISGSPITVCFESGDHGVIRLAKQCLVDAQINPDCVKLVSINKRNCPALAYQNFTGTTTEHKIELNFDLMSKKPLDTQKAILNHEIQHLVHYDPLEAGYITRILGEYGYTQKDYTYMDSMIQYCKQREHRADLLASCNNLAVAKAFQEDFAKDMKCLGQDDPDLWVTHPSDKKRHQEISNLIAQMEIEESLKANIPITIA